MALKWQEQQNLLPAGEKFDLFRGVAAGDATSADQPVESIARTIKVRQNDDRLGQVGTGWDSCCLKPGQLEMLVVGYFSRFPFCCLQFSSSSSPRCLAFSPDGRYLVTGSSDGLIEVWDFMTGKLALDLEYQRKVNCEQEIGERLFVR